MSDTAGATYRDIHATLTEGATLSIEFASYSEFHKFRTTLESYKVRAEEEVIAMGGLVPRALVGIYNKDTWIATIGYMQEAPKKAVATFKILSIT